MASAYARRPVTLESLARTVGLFKYLALPILGGLLAAALWVHDTNATVKEYREESKPSMQRIERKVDSLSWKVDLLLEDRNRHD